MCTNGHKKTIREAKKSRNVEKNTLMSPIKATSKQTHNSKCQPVKNRQTDRQLEI